MVSFAELTIASQLGDLGWYQHGRRSPERNLLPGCQVAQPNEVFTAATCNMTGPESFSVTLGSRSKASEDVIW